MQLSYIVSSFSALLAASYAAPSSLVPRDSPFVGTGTISMVHDTDGAYMGCLTVDGLLTVDTSLCGTYTGTYQSGSTVAILLSTSAGACGTTAQGAQFACGPSIAIPGGNVYEAFVDGDSTILFTGDLSFTFAPYADTYPTGSETTTIHYYGGDDSGNFVVMSWNAL